MKAFLDAPREQVQVADKPFVVQPYNTGKYKFRVVGTGEFSNAKKPFVSDKQAVAFAAERNRAVKLRANAPMPRHARGADPERPFCRVAPLNSDTYRPDLRYRAHVYFEGEKTAKEWKFRTEKRSLEFANRKNLEFERERAQVVGARPRPARAPRRELAAMPTPEDVEKPKPGVTPRVQWTKDQIDGIDSGHHYNPMKGPPFRIHSTTQAGYSFVVCGPTLADKNRERRCFKTEREAKTYAHMRNTEAQTQGFDSLSFPAWLRVTAQRCHGQLSERGKSLEDATRYYLEDLDRTEKSISLGDIVKRCLAAKKEAGFTKGYLYSLRRGLHLFRHTLGEKRIISEITPLDMVAYLTAIPGTPSTRNSLRQMLSSLFSFADKLGFCSSNPMRGAEKEKVVDAPGGVLTPTQLAALLDAAPPAWVPFLAIGAFAGLRTHELEKLDWAQVDMVDGFIEVTAKNSKSALRRLVKIQPELDAYLRPFAQSHGRVCQFAGFIPTTSVPDAMRLAGIEKWPRNALRQSFASYHIAHFRDAAAIALEMGHTTTALIFQHYRQVVRQSEGDHWWSLRPSAESAAGKVVSMTTAPSPESAAG